MPWQIAVVTLFMTSLGSNGPVWWDRECDSAGRPIRADVRAAAHQIWDTACRRVQSLLGDASEAPELMEKVVVQVSRYLDRSGAGLFTQNTSGVLMCAFCRALRRYAMRLKRLQLVGGSAELSQLRTAGNWSALVELWLELEKLSRNVSDQTRAMVGLRLRGFDWKEIAGVLQITDTAARTAFWREVRRARLKGLGKDSKGKPE